MHALKDIFPFGFHYSITILGKDSPYHVFVKQPIKLKEIAFWLPAEVDGRYAYLRMVGHERRGYVVEPGIEWEHIEGQWMLVRDESDTVLSKWFTSHPDSDLTMQNEHSALRYI